MSCSRRGRPLGTGSTMCVEGRRVKLKAERWFVQVLDIHAHQEARMLRLADAQRVIAARRRRPPRSVSP